MTDPGRKLRTLVNFQKANMDIQAEKLTEYERRIAQLMAERDVLAKRVKALEDAKADLSKHAEHSAPAPHSHKTRNF